MGKKRVKKTVKKVARKRTSGRVRRSQNARKPRKGKELQPPKIIPAAQGFPRKQRKRKRKDVGYKRPPKETQFQPGHSGNPAGTPKSKTNLWRYVCEYLDMSSEELKWAKADGRLSMARKTAVKMVEQLVKKGLGGAAWLAIREIWNRDEGKPTEHVKIDREEALTEEDCERIRREFAKRFQ